MNTPLFNKTNTIEHVKSLAFNRNATYTGETEALKYIEKTLMEDDINIKVEYFNWNGPIRILMRLSYIIITMYLILFQLVLLVVAYLIIKNLSKRLRNISFINKEESKNIITRIPSQNHAPNRPIVIFTAHYDSLSLSIPYKLQVIIFFIYRIIILFYVLIIIFFSTVFFLDFLDVIPLSNFLFIVLSFTSFLGVIVSIPILFLVFLESPSSGSIDNASGVAILIELAKLFKKNPLTNMDILLIWTGAEEWGMKGSKKFCANHFKGLKKDFNLDNSYYINIDMVGSYIGLLDKSGFPFKRKLNNHLNDNFEATAKKLNIPIVRFNKIIKPKSDYKSFIRYAHREKSKLTISCFHSDKDSKFIHSTKDTPDKCSIENLNGCLNICSQTLNNIDLRIDKVQEKNKIS
ncbi:MAG: M28 family metallopeptidase [Promethearchaeota archaeon]